MRYVKNKIRFMNEILKRYECNKNVTYMIDYHVNILYWCYILWLNYCIMMNNTWCYMCLGICNRIKIVVVFPSRKLRQSSSFFCDTGRPRSIWWLWFHQSGWTVGMCGYHHDPCWFGVGERLHNTLSVVNSLSVVVSWVLSIWSILLYLISTCTNQHTKLII